MTKSIEEQEHIKNLVESEIFLIKDGLFPDERVRSSTFDDIGRRLKSMYNEGVKSREAEWLKVVNELKVTLEWYSQRNNWQAIDTYSEVKDCVHISDLGVKSYSEKADYAIPSGGRRTRECLIKAELMMKDLA